jgi:hypothetical protein
VEWPLKLDNTEIKYVQIFFKYFIENKSTKLCYFVPVARISFVEMSAECSIDIDTGYDLWLAEQQASYFDIEPGGGEYIQTFFPATL